MADTLGYATKPAPALLIKSSMNEGRRTGANAGGAVLKVIDNEKVN